MDTYYMERANGRLSTHSVPLMGGGTRQKPNIWYSGFYSQGDGACFEGEYSYAKDSRAKIRAHAPTDARLHAIADSLAATQRKSFYGLSAHITHTGRYYHEHSVRIDVTDRTGNDAYDAAAESIAEALRNLMRWLYRALESEWNYINSDESVDESIRANEYEFTQEGAIPCSC